jgi:UDP-N-acetylglucosamine 2-epimerase
MGWFGRLFEVVRWLLQHAAFVISDSGGLQEELPSLGVPLLIARDQTERPEAVECGAAILVGTDPERIRFEAHRLLTDAEHHQRMSCTVNPFGDGHAAARIVDLCLHVAEERSYRESD